MGRKRNFGVSACPKMVPKKNSKKERLQTSPDDRRRPDREPKMDPKLIPKQCFFGVPVFLAAPGSTLVLSYALLAPPGAHLGPFPPRLGAALGPSWAILGPPWASLPHLGAHRAPFLPHLGADWSYLGHRFGLSAPILPHPGPCLGQLAASLSHVLAHLVSLSSIFGTSRCQLLVTVIMVGSSTFFATKSMLR